MKKSGKKKMLVVCDLSWPIHLHIIINYYYLTRWHRVYVKFSSYIISFKLNEQSRISFIKNTSCTSSPYTTMHIFVPQCTARRAIEGKRVSQSNAYIKNCTCTLYTHTQRTTAHLNAETDCLCVHKYFCIIFKKKTCL